MNEFQNRMEISYTIYAPVFLEGVSTTETASDAYIIVHGYSPSTTISDGEGFLFVKELHLSGASSTTSGGEGFLTTSSRMLVIAVTETTGDGLLEAIFAVSLQGISITESTSNGYVFLQHNLSGPSQTESIGTGNLVVDKIYFRGRSTTETAGSGTVTPRYEWYQGVSLTHSDGSGIITPRYKWYQGASFTESTGSGRITPRYLWTSGTSATETDSVGRLFADVFFIGTSTTVGDGQGDIEAPYPVDLLGQSETTSDGSGHPFVLVNVRGASLVLAYGYGFLYTKVYLGPGLEEPIPPSVTATMGHGAFGAPYPRPMDGSSLTVTDGEGRITEAKCLSGMSITETDGDGVVKLSIQRVLMGVGVTLTDGEGRITEAKCLSGRSITETDGTSELPILRKPDLMKYLPAYYEKSTIMKAIQDAYAEELGYVYYFLEDFLKQFLTPTTATWGLEIWERILGIQTDKTKPLDQRRSIIIAKMRGTGTVNIEQIKNIAAAFLNGQVDVQENFASYSIDITFTDYQGVPPNRDDLTAVLRDLIPAHLEINYILYYLIWDDLDALNLTWDELDALNLMWDEFEVYKGGV